ncbi:hypothetical protein TNCV_1622641 [Trichonephila clavipes]|nr:hypothetical protein TNCV_1622641 [Trichonephila clavipes]
MDFIWSLPSTVSSRDTTSTREPNPVEALGVDLNSQSRAIARRYDHQRLFPPSVSVREGGGNSFLSWHQTDRFLPYRSSERVKCHRALPVKVLVSSRCLSNHFLKQTQLHGLRKEGERIVKRVAWIVISSLVCVGVL